MASRRFTDQKNERKKKEREREIDDGITQQIAGFALLKPYIYHNYIYIIYIYV